MKVGQFNRALEFLNSFKLTKPFAPVEGFAEDTVPDREIAARFVGNPAEVVQRFVGIEQTFRLTPNDELFTKNRIVGILQAVVAKPSEYILQPLSDENWTQLRNYKTHEFLIKEQSTGKNLLQLSLSSEDQVGKIEIFPISSSNTIRKVKDFDTSTLSNIQTIVERYKEKRTADATNNFVNNVVLSTFFGSRSRPLTHRLSEDRKTLIVWTPTTTDYEAMRFTQDAKGEWQWESGFRHFVPIDGYSPLLLAGQRLDSFDQDLKFISKNSAWGVELKPSAEQQKVILERIAISTAQIFKSQN